MSSEKRILIVDDNEMNRKMIARLLTKMNYTYDEASGGDMALDKVLQEKYAVIFMDYRMPEMDGIEVTKRIREMTGAYYKSVPIIAMSADEREEIQEQFLEAGMNAVLQKPLQKEEVEPVLERWVQDKEKTSRDDDDREALWKSLPAEYLEKWKSVGLDAAEGVKNCGEKELFESLVRDFYQLIGMKTNKLLQTLAQGMIQEYTIEVHALKNSARLIGAVQLSKDFASLENWGNSGNIEEIKEKTPKVLASMQYYKVRLQPYMDVGRELTKTVSKGKIKELLHRMQDAVEAFDIDGVDEAMGELSTYEMPAGCEKYVETLKAYVSDVAMEEILEIIEDIVQIIEKAE